MMFTLLKKTKIQYPLLAALLCCTSYAGARENGLMPTPDDPNTTVVTNKDAAGGEQNGSQPGATGTKYVYAELMYQYAYGADKFVANGKTISEQTKAAVAKAPYISTALDLMGSDGWELVSTVTRNFDSGYEFYYYFKKKAN